MREVLQIQNDFRFMFGVLLMFIDLIESFEYGSHMNVERVTLILHSEASLFGHKKHYTNVKHFWQYVIHFHITPGCY